MGLPIRDDLDDLLDGAAPAPDPLVSAAELAGWLSLTPRTIDRLGREGTLDREPGGYRLKASVRAYLHSTRKRGAGRPVADPGLATEKARLVSENADKVAIQNAKARAELIPAAAVRAAWLELASDLRARLLAVPSRVAARLSLDRPTAAALDAEIRAAMADLATDGDANPADHAPPADSAPVAGQPALPAAPGCGKRACPSGGPPMTSHALALIRAETFAALAPAPRLDFPAWIEATIRLPGDVSAQSGPMRLTRVQRGIAEAMGDPAIERISVVKPVRLGYTSLLSALVAYHVANDPAPVLAVLPTESDCRGYVIDDIEPIFAASPALRGLLSAESDATGRSTILSRRYPGGSLKIVAAKAPRNLRRHNARILLLDEIDAMESGAEGSPITLAERRTISFPDRKILAGSTPTLEDTSHILRLYRESDQRVFELRCPDCGGFHAPGWKDITWPEGQPEAAAYVCPDCGIVHPETRKAAMVEAGRWRITRPDVKGHAGFRTTVLVSTQPAASWGNIAREFLASKDHPDLLQSWTNTLMAEGWRQAGESIDDSELAARAEPFDLTRMPADVLVLTAGIDVQHDRLECVTLGHSRTETFVLNYCAFWGPVNTSDAPWAELDAFLGQTFPHPRGGLIRFDAAAVDSGDGQTMDRVLAFCGPRFARRIVAIKGAPGQRPAIKISATKGQRLWIVGVDGEKARLADRLKRGRSIRFADTLERRFYEELASERRIVRYTRGAPAATWERIPGRRAEALDCFVYATAVRGLLGVDLATREADLMAPVSQATARPAVARSKWLIGG